MSRADDVSRRLACAVRIALEAGRVTMGYFRRADVRVETKSDASPVTIADRESECRLRDRIGAEFPDDGVLGEEFGETRGSSGFRWIVDPIDGTKSFIFGVPLFGVLIGVERAGRSVAGVIHIPALGETVYAEQGGGCWYRGVGEAPVPARVSATRRLSDGLFVTSQVDSFARRGAASAFDALQSRAAVTRTWGDAYGYSLVATGRAAAMVDPLMHIWDAAALQPVIEEAGGRFTDWQGRPSIDSGEAIGSNGLVHDEVLAVTRPFGHSHAGA
ncbi:MAG: histidinol-phosphatase [Planctomycetes bacterium]|nr:histidinol-phosphatase [Planctomycetota bacterium]